MAHAQETIPNQGSPDILVKKVQQITKLLVVGYGTNQDLLVILKINPAPNPDY